MITKTDEILYSTRFPYGIPFGIVIDLFTLLFFTYHMIVGVIPVLNGLIYIGLTMTLVDLVICRYAGKIVFMKDKVIIKYFFPWRKDYTVSVENITSLKTESSVQVYLSNYSIIALTLESDEVERINIVSWYGGMNGVKIVEEKFNSIYRKN